MRAQTVGGVTPLTLSEAVARAMAANPTIAAARLQRPIDIAGVSVAGERPNPDLQYEASRETPHQAISAALPIELGGKRQRRVDLAQATVAVGDADLARVIADVRRDVRRAYFEAVAADTRGTDRRAMSAHSPNARATPPMRGSRQAMFRDPISHSRTWRSRTARTSWSARAERLQRRAPS